MNKKEIGKAIIARRDTLNITQARLAKLSGVSVHTISNLETGEGNVTLEMLIKISEIIGYKVTVGI
jgi:transcriptional regulator with XRE-family HTH domain